MNRHPHKSETAIGILRRHVASWRRANSWTIETVCDEIVRAHAMIGAIETTGVEFKESGGDEIRRQRTNSERIMRWLDDESKENNLLTLNMLPSLLAALPVSFRLSALNEMLRPVQMGVHSLSAAPGALPGRDHFAQALHSMIQEASEAQGAVLELLDGITPGELAAAQKELSEAVTAFRSALAAVEQRIGAES